MRKFAWLAAVVTLVSSGGYIFVYLYRWEWHRALIVAVLFIAAEVATAAALVYRRVGALQRRLEDRWEDDDQRRAATPDPAVVDALRSSRPRRDHFAWLDPRSGRTAVFIPVLLGSGAIVSALAWLVERLAGQAAEPTMARRLGRELSTIALPRGGFVAEERELLAQDGETRHDEDLCLLLGPGTRQ